MSRTSEKWSYDPSNFTLNYEGYQVDLEEFTSCAAVLDLLMQVATKRSDWISEAALGDLVRQVNLLVAPQEWMCSFRTDKGKKTAEQIRRRVRANEERLAGYLQEQQDHEPKKSCLGKRVRLFTGEAGGAL